MTEVSAAKDAVAIIGMAGRFPGARSVDELWQALTEGRELLRHFTNDELAALGVPADTLNDPNFVPVGGQVPGLEDFDYEYFGLPPKEAALMDPQQRLLLQCAVEALDHAGAAGAATADSTGVFVGVGLPTYLLFNLLGNPAVGQQEAQLAMLGNDKDFASSRLAYHLDLRGPSLTVQTGCSTSLVATHQARESLLNFECDMALAGGATVVLPQRTGYVFHPDSTASSDGHCRAFDADGDGTVFASGAGIVVLKRLEDAVADGDTIYAVMLGSATNNDGANRVGFTAPGVDGQAEVIVRAHRVADVDPDTIGLVEAHGTATALGDPNEVAALTRAFRTRTARQGFCALGSVKSTVGHLDAAAGVTGLIKATLALHHGVIPATLHFRRPNPALDLETSPFFVPTSNKTWPSSAGPRRAGVSAFGFGGANAHVVLEEAPLSRPVVPARADGDPTVLVASARTPRALEGLVDALASDLDAPGDRGLLDVAHTLGSGRRHAYHPYRAAVVVAAGEAPADRLRDARAVRQGIAMSGRGVLFLAPGLGDHYPGMGRGLYADEPVFRSSLDACADAFSPILGRDIRRDLFDGTEQSASGTVDLRRMLGRSPDSPLLRTVAAHPSQFAVEYAIAMLWQSWNVRPDAIVGHSMGEYVAAVLAGVFDLDDMARFLGTRSHLVDDLPAGRLLAIEGERSVAEQAIEGLDAHVALLNSPTLTVLAGQVEAIEEVQARLGAMGAVFRSLAADRAYHTPLLQSLVQPLTESVSQARLRAPQVPFISNVTGTWITDDQALDPHYWGRHSAQQVRFSEALTELDAWRSAVAIEIGPGRSLGSLLTERRQSQEAITSAGAVVSSLPPSYDGRRSDAEVIRDSAARLWVEGVEVDWSTCNRSSQARKVPIVPYPFATTRVWIDPANPELVHAARASNNGEQIMRARWSPRHDISVSAPKPGTLAGEHWAVLGPETDVAAWVDALADSGARLSTAALRDDAGAADLADGTTVERFFAEAIEQHGDLTHLIWVMPDSDATTAAADVSAVARSCATLDAAPGEAEIRLWFVLRGSVPVLPGEQVVDPGNGLRHALGAVVPQECPRLDAMAIDVSGAADPRVLVGSVLGVIAHAPQARIVVVRGAALYLEEFLPADESLTTGGADSPRRLHVGDVVVVVGGLGRLGSALSEYLVRERRVSVVLVGRSADGQPLPPLLARLVAEGADIKTASVDVTDAGALGALVRALQDAGRRVAAVVHVAGRTGTDAVIPMSEVDAASLAQISNPHVLGVPSVVDVASVTNVPSVVVVSSNAAVFGGIGMLGYAGAHRAGDLISSAREGSAGPRVLSINLEEVVAAGDDRLAVSFSQYAITTSRACQLLLAALESDASGRLTLINRDLDSRMDRWVRKPHQVHQEVSHRAGGGAPRPDLDTQFEDPVGDTERLIAEVWASMLGLQTVGRHDNFYALGGHSLIATQIVSRLRAAGLPRASLLVLLTHPTVAGLASEVNVETDETDETDLPLTSRELVDELALPSYAQRRFWFLDELTQRASIHHIVDQARVRGPLDVNRLQVAVRLLVTRHPVLRTGLETVRGELWQRVHATAEVAIDQVDLSNEPREARDEQVRSLVAGLAERAFALDKPPLMRITIVSSSGDEHLLVVVMHHSIGDGWSSGLFLGELAAVYDGWLDVDSLPELPFTYADYSAWHRDLIESTRGRAMRDYWIRTLDGAPRLSTVPTDRPRPAIETHNGASHHFRLSDAAVARVRHLSRETESTTFMVLLAALARVLHRATGEDDLVVGTPIANRTRPELEGIIGSFVSMAPIRLRGPWPETIEATLPVVKDVTLGAYANQEVPFEVIVEDSGGGRSLSGHPIFQVVLVLQNAPLPGVDFGDAEFEILPEPTSTARFDVMMSLREDDGGIGGFVEYATDLYDAATVAALVDAFVADLVGGTQDEEPVLDGGATRAADSPSIAALVEAQARLNPDGVAVISGGPSAQVFTFAELDERVGRYARVLADRGVRRGDRVGLWLRRDPHAIAILLAVLRAGAAYVPLDPDYPDSYVAEIVATAAPTLTVGTRDAPPTAWAVDPARYMGVDQLVREASFGHPLPPVAPGVVAYVLFTSGSTGVPRGVAGTHDGMLNRLHWMWRTFPFEEGEVLANKTSWNFLDSFWEIFGALAAGIPVVVIPHERVVDPALLVATLADHRVTRLVLVPSLLRAVLEATPDLAASLPALRIVTLSGERLPSSLASAFIAAAPDVRLLNLYGSSEVAADVSWLDVTRADLVEESVPVGRPIDGCRIRILDGRQQLVPLGAEGEIVVSGDPLARGYMHDPVETASRFVPDPDGRAGDLMFRTGDRGRIDASGRLHVSGRTGQLVKVRGFRVDLSHVEAAIEQISGIAQAAAVVDGDRVVAYVESEPGSSSLDPMQVRDELSTRLPAYLLPSQLVVVEALPLTPSGKVDRLALPSLTGTSVGAAFELASTEVERAIAGLWNNYVADAGRDAADVDFFGVGGHSLLAARLVAEVREVFGVELSLRDFFAAPTIRGLAAQVQSDAERSEQVAHRAQVVLEVAGLSDEEVRLRLEDAAGEPHSRSGRHDG